MEPEVREHIFEAFFTTKEVTGTGLGLWVSHEIILKHHGFVRVRSRSRGAQDAPARDGHGTVFEVFIPDDPGLPGNGWSRQPAIALQPWVRNDAALIKWKP